MYRTLLEREGTQVKDARRVLALIIAFAMLFGMVSCSSSSKSKKSKSDKKTDKEEDEDDEDVTEKTEDQEETEISEETEDTEESETSEETEETEETGDSSGTQVFSVNADFDRIKEITGAEEIEINSYYYSLNKEDVIVDGVIACAEGDEVKDILDDMLYLGSSMIPDDVAEEMNLYECESVISYVKEKRNDVGGSHECLSVFEYEDEAAANAAFESFKTSTVGNLSLNEDEYMNTGSQGYLVFNLGTDTLMQMLLGEMTDEEIEEYKELLGDMSFLIGFYQSGNRIIEIDYITVAGEFEYVSLSFILEEGFSDPYLVENSEAMVAAYEEVFEE